jgi:hypothetical protein
MPNKSTSDYTTDFLLFDDDANWFRPTIKQKAKTPGSPKFPPDKDIDLWLRHNAPTSFEQLADIRYALYHHCSRAEFTVVMSGDDEFKLTGRSSTLKVVNDDARHYLLWKLRLRGRKNNWISALPRTRKPRY